MGSARSGALNQCQGTLCGGERSFPLCSSSVQFNSGIFFGQFNGSSVPVQAGRYSISIPQCHFSEDFPLGGDSRSSSAVHSGQEQCTSGFLVSSEPGSGVRVDSQVGDVSSVEQEVAGDDRSFCHLVQSPLFTLFFTLPRSIVDRYDCASSELGRASDVCFSTLVNDTTGSEEALIIFWGPHDSHCSILDTEAFSKSSSLSGSSQTTPFPLPSSEDPQAVPSSLETIKRFAKSKGFSSRVATQLGLARRSSSRAVYQAKWSVYRSWCRSENHSILRPTLPKIADFLLWLRHVQKLSVSAVMGYRSMLASAFRFKLPKISSSPILHDLLQSFKVEAPVRSVQPPSWDLNTVLCFLRSSSFEPLFDLSLCLLSKKVLFLLSLTTAKRVSELQTLSWVVSVSSEGATSYVQEFLAKTESALRPLPRSFLVRSLGFCDGP